MTSVAGLLTSQIGYDFGQPLRAIVRGPKDETLLSESATFRLFRRGESAPLLQGPVAFWGELWGSAWWVADFSELAEEGEFVLVVEDARGERFRSEPFAVEKNLLWRRTWKLSALDQPERRARLARDHVGWYDAGAEWQEANSHAALMVGLCDLIEFASDQIGDERERLEKQIVNGGDYLARLQERAMPLPGGEGAVVHQIWKFDELILPADVGLAALAWARVARCLSDANEAKQEEYASRAENALRWLETARPLGGKGFNAWNHGAPPDAPVPDEWMTRDLLTQMWASFELAQVGEVLKDDGDPYWQKGADLAERILARQVTKEQPEGTLFGHFRTFDSTDYTEKAWIHHGDGGYGADCGGTFPNYVLPLLRMSEAWPEHPQAARWKQAVHDFAYGYLLPACRANPFYLLPLGYFSGQGLLWFAGLWHGMNAAYGLTAALALEFERAFDDPAFRQIATGNLQWIAGLNAGVTAESLFAAHMFSMDIPEGVALPCSMMQGVGNQRAGNWMSIRGSICNGFSVGDQFRFDVEPTAAVDGPHAFTDEDWITHAGGWLSALARLQ